MSSPRLATPERQQLRLVPSCIDDMLADDHPARAIWSYVEGLDLTAFYSTILAVEGAPGRPAIDPKLLLALWLFATTEAVGSARQLARLCERDLAYMWLCGGVGVNYHALADFRAKNADRFEKLLVRHVAALTASGVVQLKHLAQDGVRVRANAGSSSFRRRAKLEDFEKLAQERVAALGKELHDDPQGSERRKASARKRAAEGRAELVKRALEQAKKLEEKRASSKSHKSKADQEKSKRKVAKGEVRASTTDPDAHRMKMGDGGHRPAYNPQVLMDPKSGFIVTTQTTNEGLDGAMLPPLSEKLAKDQGTRPEVVIADGGFVTKKAIDELHASGTKVCAPVDKPRTDRNPFERLQGDSEGVGTWREWMGTDEARTLYRLRPRVEWVFARFRNWGLNQFRVRTKERVNSAFLLYALTHNFMLDLARRRERAAGLGAA